MRHQKARELHKMWFQKVSQAIGTGTHDVQSGVIAQTKAAGKECEASGCTFDKKFADGSTISEKMKMILETPDEGTTPVPKGGFQSRSCWETVSGLMK